MTKETRNLAASVAARLLTLAKQTQTDYQALLTRYCLERFLYRLGMSKVRDRFVLKGAMLFRVWSDQPYRLTRDLDLLHRGGGSIEAIRRDVCTVCATLVDPDAVLFDADALDVESIRVEDEYGGFRVILPAHCGTARLKLQIDLGLGDAVWPEPRSCVYPALLDFPAPEVFAYSREAVVAEKLEAMVVLGDRNSRIKDFFDLSHLASRFEFERVVLAEAVHRTFVRRHTPIPEEAPIGLTPAYWENPSRPMQVRAFARRAGVAPPDIASIESLATFLLPILDDVCHGERQRGIWPPGGPWQDVE